MLIVSNYVIESIRIINISTMKTLQLVMSMLELFDQFGYVEDQLHFIIIFVHFFLFISTSIYIYFCIKLFTKLHTLMVSNNKQLFYT